MSADFFFWSSPNFGQRNGLGFGLENVHFGLYNSQIPAPPPFENPAYATEGTINRIPGEGTDRDWLMQMLQSPRLFIRS